MYQWLAMVGLFVVLATGLPSRATAGEYESGFGFGISVPDVWLVLTRGEVSENAEIFLGNGADSGLESVPLAMRRAIYDRVLAGQLEIFYRRDIAPGSFVDNVNVLMQPADLPSTASQLSRICEILPQEFSRVFGRPVAMDVCEMRQRVGRRALYLQFGGAVPGTTTLQYQLQKAPNSTLIVTATASTENLPRIMNDFEGMIASIRMH